MPWYYAEEKERRGPVDDAQFRLLVTTGKIGPETLVWKVGMAAWQPLRAVPDAVPAAAPTLPGHQRCIILGREFPETQMIKTEHGWVSGEAKDTYYQSLREGLAIPVHVGETNARRDGKKFVVPLANPKLPARCVKTNTPVSSQEWKTKTYYWMNPWIYLTLLVGWIITLVIYFVVRKKVVLNVPLSAGARQALNRRAWIASAVAFLGLGLLIFGGVKDSGLLALLGIVLALGSVIYASVACRLVLVTRINNGEVWIKGAGPEFLASLPPYQ